MRTSSFRLLVASIWSRFAASSANFTAAHVSQLTRRTRETNRAMSERRDTSSLGQALEFEIWSDLIKQSQGAVHIFLPLLDRGLDAVVHRMTDGRYIPVQIKGRTALYEGSVEISVPAESLVDDDALIIASLVFDVPDQVDLVVTERNFKELAAHEVSGGVDRYVVA